jgi:hypothetical protein
MLLENGRIGTLIWRMLIHISSRSWESNYGWRPSGPYPGRYNRLETQGTTTAKRSFGATDARRIVATGKAMRLIDLMNKNLGTLTSELQDHHLKVIGETNLEVMAIAVSSLSADARQAFLTGLGDQLQIYGNELLTVRDNVEAARQLEAKSLDAAKGAEDLAKLLDRALIADFLLKQGFSLDEIAQMYENLTSYASRVRRVFQDLATLQQKVDKCSDEQSQLASSVNKVYWHIGLSRIAEELKKGAPVGR